MDAATLSMLPPNVLAAYLRDPRQQLFSQMVEQGTDTSPVQSPWQGLARMVKAGVGAWQGGKLQDQYNKQAQDQADERRSAMAVALGRPAETEKLQNGGTINWNAQAPNYAAASGMLGSGNQELQDKLMQAQLAQNAQNAGFEHDMARQKAEQQFLEAQQARMIAAENARQQAGFANSRSLADLAQQNALQMKNLEYQNDPNMMMARDLMGGGSLPESQSTGMAQQGQQGQILRGDEYLKTLPPQIALQVKGLAEGKIPFPSSFALSKPYWQQIMGAVSQYDPNFDAINYASRAATRKSFTSGADAGNIAALNTAIAHLGSLQKAYSNLNNTAIPAWNYVANTLGTNLGDAKTQANAATVSADSEAVAHELAKVFRSSGMSEGEIKAWKDQISTNASPAQSKALIQSAVDLLHGRLQALGEKYNQGMGTTQDPLRLLSPEAQATYDKLNNGNATSQAALKLKSAGYTDEQIAEYMQMRGMQ